MLVSSDVSGHTPGDTGQGRGRAGVQGELGPLVTPAAPSLLAPDVELGARQRAEYIGRQLQLRGAVRIDALVQVRALSSRLTLEPWLRDVLCCHLLLRLYRGAGQSHDSSKSTLCW